MTFSVNTVCPWRAAAVPRPARPDLSRRAGLPRGAHPSSIRRRARQRARRCTSGSSPTIVPVPRASAGSAYAAADAVRIRAAVTSYARLRHAGRRHAPTPRCRRAGRACTERRRSTPAERRIGPSVFDDRTSAGAALLSRRPTTTRDMPYQPSWFDSAQPDEHRPRRDLEADRRRRRRRAPRPALRPVRGARRARSSATGPGCCGVPRCSITCRAMLPRRVRATTAQRHGRRRSWTGNAAADAMANLQASRAAHTSASRPLDADRGRLPAGGAPASHDNAKLMETLVTTVVDQACRRGTGFGDDRGVRPVRRRRRRSGTSAKTVQAAIQVANNVLGPRVRGLRIADDAVSRLGVLARIARCRRCSWRDR